MTSLWGYKENYLIEPKLYMNSLWVRSTFTHDENPSNKRMWKCKWYKFRKVLRNTFKKESFPNINDIKINGQE